MPGFLFDSNLWVALTFATHPFHKHAGEQLEHSLPDRPICRTRIIELSALRLITTPAIHRVFGVPRFTNREAVNYLQSLWREIDCVEIHEPEGTRQLWLRFAGVDSTSPKIWMDAYLAAVSVQGKLEFVTLDSDFRKYESEGLSATFVD